tara:strand:- start:204 stop:674 length:471 start_codon:yes stop_codon:yes gene_type:complete
MHKADDLFLASYRGEPCAICGRTYAQNDDGSQTSSCGHHLIFKGSCRAFRYERKNIIVLCPYHHSHYNPICSPHSVTSNLAQTNFALWVAKHRPEQFKWWQEHQKLQNKPFKGDWTYRDIYVRLGGEIASKTGLLKDMKPKNHAKALKIATAKKFN